MDLSMYDDEYYQDILDRIAEHRKVIDQIEKAVIDLREGREPVIPKLPIEMSDLEERTCYECVPALITALLRVRYYTGGERNEHYNIWLPFEDAVAQLKPMLAYGYETCSSFLMNKINENMDDEYYPIALNMMKRIASGGGYTYPEDQMPEHCPWTIEELLGEEWTELIKKLPEITGGI